MSAVSPVAAIAIVAAVVTAYAGVNVLADVLAKRAARTQSRFDDLLVVRYEDLRTEPEVQLARMVEEHIPERLRHRVTRDGPVEMRPVRPFNPMRPTKREPRRQVWFRALHALPDDPALHQHLLGVAAAGDRDPDMYTDTGL